MECIPVAKLATVVTACPEATVNTPKLWLPSMNSTLPVAAVGESVAVKVTAWPNTGFAGEAETVAVLGRASDPDSEATRLPCRYTCFVHRLPYGAYSNCKSPLGAWMK